MNEVTIASSYDDAAAVEAVKEHHAHLAGALTAQVEALLSAATDGSVPDAEAARQALVHWCERDLLPHATAEEQVLYPAAQQTPEGPPVVAGLLGEHRALSDLVAELTSAPHPVRASAAGRALLAVFQSHLEKENELVLPLLARDPGISLSGLVDAMHELGEHAGTTQTGCGGHSCSCGEQEEDGYPELDARTIPHAIRHATVFGALDTLAEGGGLVLVAPHDPLPLLAQIQRRCPDAFAVSYLQRGPEAWRLLLKRTA
jgi:uncharacterized protein (DUF2249 family)/iron-sulfur cluster repair protein YtfE (RIC family)